MLGRQLRLQSALLLTLEVFALNLRQGQLALQHDLKLLVVHQLLLDVVVVGLLRNEVLLVGVRLRLSLEIHLYLLRGVASLRVNFWSLFETRL